MEKSSKTEKATSCDLSLERTLKSASSSGCQKDQRVPAFNVNQKHPDACGILCSTLSVLNTPFKRITEYKFNNVSSSREIHALQTKPAHNQVYNLEKTVYQERAACWVQSQRGNLFFIASSGSRSWKPCD